MALAEPNVGHEAGCLKTFPTHHRLRPISTGGPINSTTSGSSNRGPHDSNMANKLDPRVDSDKDAREVMRKPHSADNTGSGLTGSRGTQTPHDEHSCLSDDNHGLISGATDQHRWTIGAQVIQAVE